MKRASQQEMEAVVASFKCSGLTQREFCLRENIKLPTFSYWYRKINGNSKIPVSGFTEVTAPVQSVGLEVVFPKSTIGKAMAYTMGRWVELSNYLMDGVLEIDNNAIENVIRPVALGRKNYLFAGSHDAAQRAAMIYSFFAMCKYEEVNPQQWLKYVFDNIMDTNIQKIQEPLPKNYKMSLVKNQTK